MIVNEKVKKLMEKCVYWDTSNNLVVDMRKLNGNEFEELKEYFDESENDLTDEFTLLTIKNLAQKTLHDKWLENQNENKNEINDICAFCDYQIYKTDKLNCNTCLAPKQLCRNAGQFGLIYHLMRITNEKHKHTILSKLLCIIDSTGYDLMRLALIELSTEGKLSEKMINQITNYCQQ